MSQTGQTYKNHVRWFPPFHFFVAPVLLLNFLNSAWNVWASPTAGTVFACLVGAALFLGALLARVMAVTVQDRLICLEMRLRLREALPADLQSCIGELTRDHMVALRFASNAEIPDLVRQVRSGDLTTKKEIKMRIKSWQGDYLRA